MPHSLPLCASRLRGSGSDPVTVLSRVLFSCDRDFLNSIHYCAIYHRRFSIRIIYNNSYYRSCMSIYIHTWSHLLASCDIIHNLMTQQHTLIRSGLCFTTYCQCSLSPLSLHVLGWPYPMCFLMHVLIHKHQDKPCPPWLLHPNTCVSKQGDAASPRHLSGRWKHSLTLTHIGVGERGCLRLQYSVAHTAAVLLCGSALNHVA